METLPVFEKEIEVPQHIESMSREELVFLVLQLISKNEKLREDLIHDHLTGLKTRRFLDEELEMYVGQVHEGEHRKEGYTHASILILDVDHFKNINDTRGHPIGDLVLRSVAKTIAEHVRATDVAARWGGEEFAVLLFGANEDEAAKKAEEIREAVEKLDVDPKRYIPVTVSVGVTECIPGVSREELIHKADVALYEAKNAGRNRVVRISTIAHE